MAVLMILTVAIAPAITAGIDDAKLMRARHDLTTITGSILRLTEDVYPHRYQERAFASYSMLVGPGLAPESDDDASRPWTYAASARGVGLLNDHLILNTGSATAPQPPTPGWRGAYLEPAVGPDPWGYRYAVNVAALSYRDIDTVTITAGANGRIQTDFAADGALPMGDDMLKIVTSGGLPRFIQPNSR